ncbi:MAG: TraR/DksA family transcriptional regulator [Gemmataceae bacterium]|nr:TraR/DksA family transcriptional regulator [Gemmataceae bacterium]
MARDEALIRLQKSLLDRREELLKRLGDELRDFESIGESGDSADQAFDSCGEEVSSQVAQIESDEFLQVERALDRLARGVYGLCEVCQKKIPIARLNALPFITTCIQCKRAMEVSGSRSNHVDSDWERVSDTESRLRQPRETDISKLEWDFAK